jgi:mobilization protein NikA
MVKPPLRTKTLSTKVSQEEFGQLEAAASESGLTPSEWCRETLLASVNGQEPKACDPVGPAMRSWPSWWRAILLNVLFKLANGQTLTAEEMQR